jgi:hypothetical protein
MLYLKPALTFTLALQLAAPAAWTQEIAAQEASGPAPFHIVVLEGEGSINNIKQQVNRGALVLIEDENRNPLPGAAVTFYLPSEGPSGVFLNGSRVLTVFTDNAGLAASRGIRFNNLVGLMRIKVSASSFSQVSKGAITQTNVSSAASVKSSYVPATRARRSSGGPVLSRKAVVWIAVAGAGVAAAVYFGTKTTPPSAGIGGSTIGAPTIGGPK